MIKREMPTDERERAERKEKAKKAWVAGVIQ
jgi:hypothetical protein